MGRALSSPSNTQSLQDMACSPMLQPGLHHSSRSLRGMAAARKSLPDSSCHLYTPCTPWRPAYLDTPPPHMACTLPRQYRL